jgi:hypothetical protein
VRCIVSFVLTPARAFGFLARSRRRQGGKGGKGSGGKGNGGGGNKKGQQMPAGAGGEQPQECKQS